MLANTIGIGSNSKPGDTIEQHLKKVLIGVNTITNSKEFKRSSKRIISNIRYSTGLDFKCSDFVFGLRVAAVFHDYGKITNEFSKGVLKRDLDKKELFKHEVISTFFLMYCIFGENKSKFTENERFGIAIAILAVYKHHNRAFKHFVSGEFGLSEMFEIINLEIRDEKTSFEDIVEKFNLTPGTINIDGEMTFCNSSIMSLYKLLEVEFPRFISMSDSFIKEYSTDCERGRFRSVRFKESVAKNFFNLMKIFCNDYPHKIMKDHGKREDGKAKGVVALFSTGILCKAILKFADEIASADNSKRISYDEYEVIFNGAFVQFLGDNVNFEDTYPIESTDIFRSKNGMSPRGFQKDILSNKNYKKLNFFKGDVGTGKTAGSDLEALKKGKDFNFICLPTNLLANIKHSERTRDYHLKGLLKDGIINRSEYELGLKSTENANEILSDLNRNNFEDKLIYHSASKKFRLHYFVGTFDQLYLMLSGKKREFILLKSFFNGCITLDELDAIEDTMMIKNYNYMCKILGCLEIDTNILTATLTKKMQLDLINSYNFCKKDKIEVQDMNGEANVYTNEVNEKENTKRAIICNYKGENCSEKSLIEEISTLAKSGKKVFFFLNKNDSVIRFYENLKTCYDGKVIIMSTKLSKKRQKKERNELLEVFGKNNNWHDGAVAILSPQCEVGADISSDVMYTEICPPRNLSQRAGRLNRWFIEDYKNCKLIVLNKFVYGYKDRSINNRYEYKCEFFNDEEFSFTSGIDPYIGKASVLYKTINFYNALDKSYLCKYGIVTGDKDYSTHFENGLESWYDSKLYTTCNFLDGYTEGIIGERLRYIKGSTNPSKIKDIMYSLFLKLDFANNRTKSGANIPEFFRKVGSFEYVINGYKYGNLHSYYFKNQTPSEGLNDDFKCLGELGIHKSALFKRKS